MLARRCGDVPAARAARPGAARVTHRQHPPGDFAPPASRGELWGYLAAAIALSVAVFGVHRALGHEAFYGTVTGPLVLWAPALVAMAAAWRRTRGLAILGVGTGASRWWLVGLGGPVAALLAVDGALAAAGLVVYSGSVRGLEWPLAPVNLFEAAGEELGFRGWLVPAMASRYGFRRAALGSSAAWFAWHLPGAIWGGRGRGGAGRLRLGVLWRLRHGLRHRPRLAARPERQRLAGGDRPRGPQRCALRDPAPQLRRRLARGAVAARRVWPPARRHRAGRRRALPVAPAGGYHTPRSARVASRV
jgi:membrane protease YdiL (CAAX protease family)